MEFRNLPNCTFSMACLTPGFAVVNPPHDWIISLPSPDLSLQAIPVFVTGANFHGDELLGASVEYGPEFALSTPPGVTMAESWEYRRASDKHTSQLLAVRALEPAKEFISHERAQVTVTGLFRQSGWQTLSAMALRADKYTEPPTVVGSARKSRNGVLHIVCRAAGGEVVEHSGLRLRAKHPNGTVVNFRLAANRDHSLPAGDYSLRSPTRSGKRSRVTIRSGETTKAVVELALPFSEGTIAIRTPYGDYPAYAVLHFQSKDYPHYKRAIRSTRCADVPYFLPRGSYELTITVTGFAQYVGEFTVDEPGQASAFQLAEK